MATVSIVIPARNEQFLPQTINDLLAKARGEIEIIAVLDGYWPDPIISDPRVHYIHFTEPRGMRATINMGVTIAKGKFIMKLDAHCMVAEGFDEVLSSVCQDNWICVPTRHRLDAENWVVNDGNRSPINYLYMDHSNDEVNFKEWREKNNDRSLDAIRIDDILSCQGSCYFMPRDYFYELELLDEEHYGTFRKDPQEVSFKAWCSGGRVVRIKDTWYAHLHKGKQYGRGYSTSRPDWAKGDEYVKRWFTDSAWGKQTVSFRTVMEHFSDMPGWVNFQWPTPAPEETTVQAPVEVPALPLPGRKLPNLYQYLEIGGQSFSKPHPDRAASKFWNEGRWHTFIEPLLPEECMDGVFVEMGCDAGLYLKLATDWGFRWVVGIEKNRTPVAEGLRYRDALGYRYRLLKRTLGGAFHEAGSFDIDELPVADVTLLSTFHYYVDINAWIKYVDNLRAKTCRVLIVSRPDLKDRHWEAGASYDAIRGYFDGWWEVGKIEGVPTEGDPKPRELFSVLLENPLLRRVPIEAIDTRGKPGDPMYQAMIDLAERIADGEPFDPLETEYYQRWGERKAGKWSERTLRRFVTLKASVMYSVRDEGPKEPLLVERDTLKLCDGGHRLVVLRALGCHFVIVREI